MTVTASIFLDLTLPNPPTWFYFSGLLAVALFFKFSRLLSVRNLDVLTLYLPMPGFLLLVEHGKDNFFGYLWLLVASACLLARCLFDLALVRRPALGPNLDLGGLAWLGGALFVSLIALAVRQPSSPAGPNDSGAATARTVSTTTEKAIQPVASGAGLDLTLWVERGLALVCHLSVVVGLCLVGWLHFDDLRSGMSAATFYLLLPYSYLLLPSTEPGIGGWDHAWAMALMIWAVFVYRRPTLSGMFLGLAAGSAFFPVLTFPVWLGFYRKAGAGRFAASFLLSATVCLALFGAVWWANDDLPRSLRSAWTESAWQPWKRPGPTAPGFWQNIPGERAHPPPDAPSEPIYYAQAAYRLPVFLASMALVVLTAFWPTPKNLAHVLALSAAILLGVQFWYADRGGAYVFWYLPFLLLLVFRPNLADARPPPPVGDDWIARAWRRARVLVLRWWRRPAKQVARVG